MSGMASSESCLLLASCCGQRLGSGCAADHGTELALVDGGAQMTTSGGICFPSPFAFMLLHCLLSLLRSSSKPSALWRFWMTGWWMAFRRCL